MRQPGGLRRGTGHGTHRYYLSDRPVHGGDALELCLAGGWIVGRFESDSGMPRPRLYFSVELEGGGQAQSFFEIPEGALARWPG